MIYKQATRILSSNIRVGNKNLIWGTNKGIEAYPFIEDIRSAKKDHQNGDK